MNSPNLRRELSKLRILQALSTPEAMQFGATAGALPAVEPLVDGDRLLSAMRQDGLIERRRDPSHKTAKPYFITESGSDYLENSPDREMLLETQRSRDWATRMHESRLDHVVSGIVRCLPEFEGASPRRVDDVARQITEAITQAADIGDSPSPARKGRC